MQTRYYFSSSQIHMYQGLRTQGWQNHWKGSPSPRSKKIFRFSGPPLEARQWSSASSRDFSKEDLQEVKSKQINIKNSQFETAHGFYYNDGFIVCDATR